MENENCKNCGNTFFTNSVCIQCGQNKIGIIGSDPNDTKYILCSKCCEKNFDGWKCHNCNYEIPLKNKKMQGRALNEEECKKLMKYMGRDN